MVDLVPALKDHDLKQLGGVALWVLACVVLQQDVPAHLVHGLGVLRIGQERRSVNRHVVVECRHHVGEVVLSVGTKHSHHALQQ